MSKSSLTHTLTRVKGRVVCSKRGRVERTKKKMITQNIIARHTVGGKQKLASIYDHLTKHLRTSLKLICVCRSIKVQIK